MSYVTVSMKPAPANGTVRREIERLLQDVMPVRSTMSFEPLAMAREDATGFSIELDLPGVAIDQIDAVAEDGVLLVRGKRPVQENAEGVKVLFNERVTGAFERRFRLPKSADFANVSAEYSNGVLTLRVGKLASLAPRRVPINVGAPAKKTE